MFHSEEHAVTTILVVSCIVSNINCVTYKILITQTFTQNNIFKCFIILSKKMNDTIVKSLM